MSSLQNITLLIAIDVPAVITYENLAISQFVSIEQKEQRATAVFEVYILFSSC